MGEEVTQKSVEDQFQILACATSDAVWEWDLEAGLIWWGDGVSSLFGFERETLEPEAQPWIDRIHSEDRERVMGGLNAALAGERAHWSDQYRFCRSDGGYARVVNRGVVIRDDQGKATRMVGAMTDRTSELMASDELRRSNRALLMRSRLSRQVILAKSERELLESACQIATQLGGYQTAWVGYSRPGEGAPIEIVARVGGEQDLLYIDALRLSWDGALPEGGGPSSRALQSGKAVTMRDFKKEASFSPWALQAQALGYRGGIALPLIENGSAFGVISLVRVEEPDASEEEEAELLQGLADDLAFGICNLRAQRETERLHEAVVKVAAGVSGRVGAEFFERLARDLAQAVGARCAMVTKALPAEFGQPALCRVIAAVRDGVAQPAFDYPVEGSLTEPVFSEGSAVVRDGLSERYPNSPMSMFGANAYLGVRLDHSAGAPLGALCVGFEVEIKNEALVASTLLIFAARAAAEIERQEADALIRDQASLLDKAQDAIIARSADGRAIFWSKGAERLYGWSSEEALGRELKELLYAEPHAFEEANAKTAQSGEWSGELSQRKRDGSPLTVEARWSSARDESGRPSSVLEINTDITHKKAAQKEIQSLAFYDPLTALPNRLLLIERLQSALGRCSESGERGALLFIDLDNFKTLNDTMGHEKGDALLRQVAQRLKENLGEIDTLARLGGDEFVALLSSLHPNESEAAAQAEAVAQRALQELSRVFSLGDFESHGSASVGVAMFCGQDQSVGELLKRADLAMYQAKASGRNALRFFDPKMQSAISARAALEADLRQGLRLGQFELHFQPQLDQRGRVTGAEALARWRHPARGMVSPADFIPLAEDTGLILPLGHRVLELACERLAVWAKSPLSSDLDLAVNVSMRQFRHPEFVAQVGEVIHRFGVNPKRLKLEITESLMAENVEDTIVKMEALKESGVSFSLDDFGTGYSSLSYLKRLPLDQLKIDQSFVRDVLTDPNDAAIAKTIVALGQSLGLSVIAEGVETEEQRQFLQDNGCLAYQGYLFSRPLPRDQFDEFLERSRQP